MNRLNYIPLIMGISFTLLMAWTITPKHAPSMWEIPILLGFQTLVISFCLLFPFWGVINLYHKKLHLIERNGGGSLLLESFLGREMFGKQFKIELTAYELQKYVKQGTYPVSVLAVARTAFNYSNIQKHKSLIQRANQWDQYTDQGTKDALFETIVWLMISGYLKLYPAEETVAFYFPAIPPPPQKTLYLFQAVGEKAPFGYLEALIWRKIKEIETDKMQERSLPDINDLIRTFSNWEDDFDREYILATIKEEALKQSWFEKPPLSPGKHYPVVANNVVASIKHELKSWEQILHKFKQSHSFLYQSLHEGIESILGTTAGKKTMKPQPLTLDWQMKAYRKRLLYIAGRWIFTTALAMSVTFLLWKSLFFW